jgi:hypothetical protein
MAKALFHSYLGDVCYMNNQRDKAIAAYHTALKYSPDYLWLRRYLDFLELYPQSIYYDDVRLRLRELAS